MQATPDRELNSTPSMGAAFDGDPILIDLSDTESSADAIRHLEFVLETTGIRHQYVELDTGSLLLTPGVLSRVKDVVRRSANRIHTLYSLVPQTQQTALDEGLLVRRQPLEHKTGVNTLAAVNLPMQSTSPSEVLPSAAQKAAETDAKSQAQTKVTFKVSRAKGEATQTKATLTTKPSTLAQADDQQAHHNQAAAQSAPQSTQPMDVFDLLLADTATPCADEAVVDELPQHLLKHHPGQQAVVDEAAVTRLNLNPDMGTTLVKQTLRSGQVLEADGHVLLLGDAHSGSEIIARGDIVVWGVLGGLAHAGAGEGPMNEGADTQAEIRALRIEAVQLRIGPLIARRPDRLFKPDEASATAAARGPEVARVVNEEIRIYRESVDRPL
ncbi:MAG: hypothetical protein KC474_04450 [Cyanobacteria bacterium HKST-UBA04]|nr:hypothetical protein [Cyanobacteria bacterium HKST-UBA04]MCA9841650.1 hypothetical protein [Cyanobacteria bacterium HKST-UBA03]